MTMPGFTAEAVFRPISQTYRASLETTPDAQVYVYPATCVERNHCMQIESAMGAPVTHAWDRCKHIFCP
jgi:hypothetical protein